MVKKQIHVSVGELLAHPAALEYIDESSVFLTMDRGEIYVLEFAFLPGLASECPFVLFEGGAVRFAGVALVEVAVLHFASTLVAVLKWLVALSVSQVAGKNKTNTDLDRRQLAEISSNYHLNTTEGLMRPPSLLHNLIQSLKNMIFQH